MRLWIPFRSASDSRSLARTPAVVADDVPGAADQKLPGTRRQLPELIGPGCIGPSQRQLLFQWAVADCLKETAQRRLFLLQDSFRSHCFISMSPAANARRFR
jgi:hypothetical protein